MIKKGVTVDTLFACYQTNHNQREREREQAHKLNAVDSCKRGGEGCRGIKSAVNMSRHDTTRCDTLCALCVAFFGLIKGALSTFCAAPAGYATLFPCMCMCACVCACCKLKSRQMIDGDFGL